MTNNQQYKISPIAVTALAACLSLTAVFGFAVFWPLWLHRQAIATQAEQLDIQKAKAAQLQQDVRELKQSQTKTRLAMAMTPLKLEPDDHLNARLADITGFSRQCGLEIGDILPGAASPGARYETISIHMVGQGSYRACIAFLHELHRNFLDTTVRGFRLSSSTEDAAAPLSVEFDLVWFARPGSVAQSE